MLKNIFRSVSKGLGKHGPAILTGIGITGMAVATVLAIKSTPKAVRLIEEKKKADDVEELTKKEIVETLWKCYVPTAVAFTLSAACIIFSSHTNLRRNTALATACTLAETTLKNYREEVVNIIGEEKEHKIRDAVSKKAVENNPPQNKEVINLGKGGVLCYDLISGRYFNSDTTEIQKAVNEINRQLVREVCVSLNELYYELGLSPTRIGETLGWNVDDGLIEVRFSSLLADDGTPCLVLDYINPPRYNFEHIY